MILKSKILFYAGLIGFAVLAAGFASRVGAETSLAVAHVNSGDEIVLNDGRTVSLEGIKAPRAGSGALSEKSISFLETLTDHKSLFLDNPITDRYGRLRAQVYLTEPDGKEVWVQQAMLRHGLAFVYPPTGNEDRIGDMLDAETEAYDKHEGIWNDPVYADTPTRQAEDLYGHFAFVTGKVVKTERVKNVIYLNFGSDKRVDPFSVTVSARSFRVFHKAGIEPLAYQGKMIRVRGWIKRDPGPVIAVNSPYQIQILDQR